MLCLANVTHNFKGLKITHIWLIWDQKFENWSLNTNFTPNISDLID